MKKINDFGEKIGGSRKDLWKMFHELSDEEQAKLARKDKVWPRPNFDKLLEEGAEKEALFWQNEMRKTVKVKPEFGAETYIGFVSLFRDAVSACKTMKDVESFYARDGAVHQFLDNADGSHRWKHTHPEWAPYYNAQKVINYVGKTYKIAAECGKSNFMKTAEEKERHKYEVIVAGAKNLTSTLQKDGRYANAIKTSSYVMTCYDKENYTEKLKNAEYDMIRVVIKHEGNKHTRFGVFTSDAEMKEAIEAAVNAKQSKQRAARKDAFMPPHLDKIVRTGSNYEKGYRFTDGNILIARYGLRGGEFGNYEAGKDRLASLNMCYDAFEDLQDVLGVTAKDISLGGDLAIAFGARGRGNALAHYEPLRNVINITRFRGAGSLAHEWGHAMDYYLGNKLSAHGFASANLAKAPESLKTLVESFRIQDGKETGFYKGAKHFDNAFRQGGNGYWASPHEMFARAFACYVTDKLKAEGKRSDYLSGHSECAVVDGCAAIPNAKEREVINKNFDAFIADMIEHGFFTKAETVKEKSEEKAVEDNIQTIIFFEGADGQLKFC